MVQATYNNETHGETTTPAITSMQVAAVAGHDGMLFHRSGVHAALFQRMPTAIATHRTRPHRRHAGTGTRHDAMATHYSIPGRVYAPGLPGPGR